MTYRFDLSVSLQDPPAAWGGQACSSSELGLHVCSTEVIINKALRTASLIEVFISSFKL